jgi:hypothetical protein
MISIVCWLFNGWVLVSGGDGVIRQSHAASFHPFYQSGQWLRLAGTKGNVTNVRYKDQIVPPLPIISILVKIHQIRIIVSAIEGAFAAGDLPLLKLRLPVR